MHLDLYKVDIIIWAGMYITSKTLYGKNGIEYMLSTRFCKHSQDLICRLDKIPPSEQTSMSMQADSHGHTSLWI